MPHGKQSIPADVYWRTDAEKNTVSLELQIAGRAFSEMVFDLQDFALRASLVKLGWTPPQPDQAPEQPSAVIQEDALSHFETCQQCGGTGRVFVLSKTMDPRPAWSDVGTAEALDEAVDGDVQYFASYGENHYDFPMGKRHIDLLDKARAAGLLEVKG